MKEYVSMVNILNFYRFWTNLSKAIKSILSISKLVS
jgi:hypothetical protein